MSPETTFTNPFATLQLKRWPRLPSETLRAWDGADLYLLEHLFEQRAQGPYVIFNDLCGALALSLGEQVAVSIGDSFLAQQALFANASENERPAPSWSWPEETLASKPSMVLLKVPKSLALLEYQLLQVSAALPTGTPVILAGIDKHLPPNLLSVMGRYLRDPRAGRGRHKARLFFAETEPKGKESWPSRVWVPELNVELQVDAGVFSQSSLDLGARFFMQQVPANVSGAIADLGCGNGVIGLFAAKQNPTASVWFIDESAQAIRSARRNAALSPGRDFTFHLGNGLAQIEERFSLILLNPPFHRGYSIDDSVARMLFTQASQHLAPDGRLLVIGNRELAYQQPLRRLFTNVKQLAADPRFTIWQASAPSDSPLPDGH